MGRIVRPKKPEDLKSLAKRLAREKARIIFRVNRELNRWYEETADPGWKNRFVRLGEYLANWDPVHDPEWLFD